MRIYSDKCNAIRRSGPKKGQVCGNSTNGGTYGFCVGHTERIKKSMNEGEREERRLQGEYPPKPDRTRNGSSKRKKPKNECIEKRCRNIVKTGIFCEKCLKKQWKEEVWEESQELIPLDEALDCDKRLEVGFFGINQGRYEGSGK